MSTTTPQDEAVVIIRELECELTEEDRIRIGHEQAQTELEIARLTEERREEMRARGREIKALEGHRAALAQAYEYGREVRKVECVVEYDWAAGQKRITRQDTGEVTQEPISADEMQAALPGVGDSADSAAQTAAE